MGILRQQDIDKREELLSFGFIHCTKCDTLKGVEEFYKDATRWSGRKANCKVCHLSQVKGYKRNPTAVAKRRQEQAELKKRDLKVCCNCGHLKCRSSFSRNVSSSDGIHSRCRACGRASATGFHKGATERDPWRIRLQGGYQRAKEAGLPHQWFSGEELRAYWESVGISPKHDVFTGEPLEADWHLDHLHALSSPNSPGHVPANLVPTNPSTNLSKRDRHLVHFLADRAEATKENPSERSSAGLIDSAESGKETV